MNVSGQDVATAATDSTAAQLLPAMAANNILKHRDSAQNMFAHKDFNYREFYTGLTLAVLSSFFIGSSFILKKKGLLKLYGSTSVPAAPGALSGSKTSLRACMISFSSFSSSHLFGCYN